MSVAKETEAIGSADERSANKGLYDRGKTTIFASQHDPRFSYCLYVPETFGGDGKEPDLLVAMHGTGRSFVTYRDALAPFGRWNNCIVLAPLFPVGVSRDRNADGFKYIIENSIRYDHVLLEIVEEVRRNYGLATKRFALFGYSGGGHFAHRFLLLHPDRLWAVSIGAPGSVTLLDPTRDWWVGTRNFAELFGKDLNISAIANVPVHMVVGAADLETWEITHSPGSHHWMPDANHAGRTRPERLTRLRESFEAAGVQVRFDLLPNMAHQGAQAIATAEAFLGEVLATRRSAPSARELA